MPIQKRGKDGRFISGDAAEPSREARLKVQRLLQPMRHDGWTAVRRERFIATLGATCNVKAACEAAGKSTQGAYRLRQRDAAFRRAWRQALSQSYARLEIELLERALLGEAKLRTAVAEAASAETAVSILARYRPATAELLYRVHRSEALADDTDDDASDDETERETLIATIMDRLAAARETLRIEAGPA